MVVVRRSFPVGMAYEGTAPLYTPTAELLLTPLSSTPVSPTTARIMPTHLEISLQSSTCASTFHLSPPSRGSGTAAPQQWNRPKYFQHHDILYPAHILP